MSLLILLAILTGAILFGIWLERRGQRQVLILEVPSGAPLQHAEDVADAIVDAFEDAGLRKPKLIIARDAHITALAPSQSGPDTGLKA